MSNNILKPAFSATNEDGGESVPAWTTFAFIAATVSATPPTPRIATSLSGISPASRSATRVAKSVLPPMPETPTTFPLRSCMELISGALCIVNRNLSTKFAINIASAPPRTAEGTVRLETPWANWTEPPIRAWIVRAPVRT